MTLCINLKYTSLCPCIHVFNAVATTDNPPFLRDISFCHHPHLPAFFFVVFVLNSLDHRIEDTSLP